MMAYSWRVRVHMCRLYPVCVYVYLRRYLGRSMCVCQACMHRKKKYQAGTHLIYAVAEIWSSSARSTGTAPVGPAR